MSESFLLVGGSSDIALHLAGTLIDEGHHVTLLARDVDRTQSLQAQGSFEERFPFAP